MRYVAYIGCTSDERMDVQVYRHGDEVWERPLYYRAGTESVAFDDELAKAEAAALLAEGGWTVAGAWAEDPTQTVLAAEVSHTATS